MRLVYHRSTCYSVLARYRCVDVKRVATWLFSQRLVLGILSKSLSHGAESILNRYKADEGLDPRSAGLCSHFNVLRYDRTLAVSTLLIKIDLNINGLERCWQYSRNLRSFQLALDASFFDDEGLGSLPLFLLQSFLRASDYLRWNLAGFKA